MRGITLVGLAEVEVVILVRDDGLLAVKSVHEELHLTGTGGGFLIQKWDKWTIIDLISGQSKDLTSKLSMDLP